jgi:hypothetical protein
LVGVGSPVRPRAETRIDESQFLVAERSWPGISTLPIPANGLISTAEDVAVIYVGASSGRVTVEVEARQQPPEDVDVAGWDEVVEVDFIASIGDVIVRALMDSPPNLPTLTKSGPGVYRFRVHAIGRDRNPDGVTSESLETYLIQSWPASRRQEELIYKQTDSVGSGIRQSPTVGFSTQKATIQPRRRQPPKPPTV